MNATLKNVQTAVRNQARDVYYAGLGVVATLEQESTTLYQSAERRISGVMSDAQKNFDTLAQQGRRLANRSQKAIQGEMNELEGELQETREDVARYGDRVLDQVQSVVVAALNRLGVPSREEIQTLNANVEQLSTKVDRLRAQRNSN